LAEKIAKKPLFALKTTKAAVNHVQDVQGRRNAQMHVFSLHQMMHTHNQVVWGMPMDPNGLPAAVRDKVLARVARAREEEAKKPAAE
jgi:enoyl-CoA hydratase